MAGKAKASSKVSVPSRPGNAFVGKSLTASTIQPLTTEERVHRIEAMRKRINDYIEYMCQLAGTTGTSSEVKERAVRLFYDQMVIVERQLAHIHDELRLE